MSSTNDETQAYQALSRRDKWRVRRYLRRGEAPADGRMAAAAVELAERYQGMSRFDMWGMRWGPVIIFATVGMGVISNAADGDRLGLIIWALLGLGNIGSLLFNSAPSPKNMARSLEASRQLVASIS
jgi:hypothetical protein